MNERSDVIFIGQAFNATFGSVVLERCKDRPSAHVERFVSHYSLTGKVGERLARVLGRGRLDFLVTYRRTNLNLNFSGKTGKGDNFDRDEGVTRAKAILADASLKRHVLLGANVALCFSVALGCDAKNFATFAVLDRGDKSFFCLPHPSGINRWWNDNHNVAEASRRLKEFLI